jgi:hypothetical protein
VAEQVARKIENHTETEGFTIMTKFAKALALPVLSAGFLGAVALGLAGTAAAQEPQGPGHLYSPDTYATPAPGMKPGWHNHHGPQRVIDVYEQ